MIEIAISISIKGIQNDLLKKGASSEADASLNEEVFQKQESDDDFSSKDEIPFNEEVFQKQESDDDFSSKNEIPF